VSFGNSALPPIDQSLLPADVRKGTAQDKKDYQAALGFERMLVGQLTKAMTDTAKPIDDSTGDGSADGSGDTGTDAATSQYLDMLPDQLADSLIAHGGVGLADSFYRAMKAGQK
jgi:Rod binding domain-containing protein